MISKASKSIFEYFLYGGLVGLFIGLISGSGEYFLFLYQNLPDDLATAYWEVIVPYAGVGLVGGILGSVGIWLVFGSRDSFGQLVALLFAVFLGLVLWSYMVVGSILYFGPPLFKLQNVIAYLASFLVAAVTAFLLNRALGALFLGLEKTCNRARCSLRTWTAVGLSGLSAVMFLPAFYLQDSQISRNEITSSYFVGKKQTRPNIVFILIDTLRADHLPIYGYSRQTAPNIAAFARQSVVFNRMYAPTSWTSPSVATIFTSLYPPFHTAEERFDIVPSSLTVLSEILRGAGYRTFGISANHNVSDTFGFSQGFDQFWVVKDQTALRLTMLGQVAANVVGPEDRKHVFFMETREVVPRAKTITDIALRFASQSLKQPFFAYVHYIDPHKPYRPPPPYDRAFDYRIDPPVRQGGVDPLKLVPKGHDPEEVGEILDQYDGEILYNDGQIGRLLRGLKKMGVLDNALVIITADHGEEFFEHGKLGHRETLYEEVLRVPFLITWPGRIPAGATYDGVSGLIDIAPTILDYLGIEPPDEFQGRSFAAQLAKPASPAPGRMLFAQLLRISFSLEMVLDGHHKLIRHAHGPKQGLKELYNLQQDPLERSNIALQVPRQAAVLRRELDAFNRLVSQGTGLVRPERVEKLDKETERALRSLGYIN